MSAVTRTTCCCLCCPPVSPSRRYHSQSLFCPPTRPCTRITLHFIKRASDEGTRPGAGRLARRTKTEVGIPGLYVNVANTAGGSGLGLTSPPRTRSVVLRSPMFSCPRIDGEKFCPHAPSIGHAIKMQSHVYIVLIAQGYTHFGQFAKF